MPTALPARNIFDGTALPVTSVMKAAMGAQRDYLAGLLGTTGAAIDARTAMGSASSGANSDITSLNALTSINGGQLSGFRNKIINGDMQISQVNGGTAVTPVSGMYPIDQWQLWQSAASKISAQQVVDAPAGFKYSEKLTVAAQYAPASTDYLWIDQPIEGQNIVDLGLGGAAPATIAVSLWVKGSIAGTYACSIRNGGTNRSYVGTITVAAGWAKQTVILVVDNAGTWGTDNTVGLILSIDLGSGSTFNTTANAWQAGNFLRTASSVTFVNQVVGSTLNITGVQLEQVSAGATSGTAFEHVSYAGQLWWCQRYLPCFNLPNGGQIAVGQAFGTTVGQVAVPLPQETRVPITGVVVGAGSTFSVSNATGGAVATTGFLSLSQTSKTMSLLTFSVASGIAAGNATLLWATAVSGSQIYFTGAQM